MRSALLKVASLGAALWASAGNAAPISQYSFDIQATARVVSSQVSGRIFRVDQQNGEWTEGEFVRSINGSELDRLPWSVGDEISVRWRLDPNSSYDQSCVANAGGWLTFSGFGGAGPAQGCAGPAAVSAKLRRADGSVLTSFETENASDGSHPYEFGPAINLLTGEYQLAYGNPDGRLVTADCCSYSYDPDLDAILSADGPGEFFSFFLGKRLAGAGLSFGDDSGGGHYVNSTFDFELGSYQIALSNFFRLDVDWDVRVRPVPEPGAVALLGLGSVGVAARRRRRTLPGTVRLRPRNQGSTGALA